MTLAKLEQSRQENLKVIKNTLPVKSANPESLKIIATVAKAFQLMCPQLMKIIGCGQSTGCFMYSFVVQVISEKTPQQRFYQQFEIFLHKNNRHYNSHKFSYKFAFILFLSFLSIQKQESGLQQADGLVTRNNCLFIASRALLQTHYELNGLL